MMLRLIEADEPCREDEDSGPDELDDEEVGVRRW
jgi:hypothetical protein